MHETIHGIIHGRTIELTTDPGIGEGLEVEVVLRVKSVANGAQWGDGLRRCAGALADRPELDASLEEILAERKRDTRQQVPE